MFFCLGPKFGCNFGLVWSRVVRPGGVALGRRHWVSRSRFSRLGLHPIPDARRGHPIPDHRTEWRGDTTRSL